MCYWKYVLVLSVIIVSTTIIQGQTAAPAGQPVNRLQTDTLIYSDIYDSSALVTGQDSVQRGYEILIYLMQLQINELENRLDFNRRALMIMGSLLSLLLIITLLLISKRTVFSSFPFYPQKKTYQSGLVCLQMMYRYYYGKKISYKNVKKFASSQKDPEIMSLDDLASVAENLGFKIKAVKSGIHELRTDLQLPVMAIFPNHIAIVYAHKNDNFYIADPFYGFLKLKLFYFATSWFSDNKNMKGIALQLLPVNNISGSVARKTDPEKYSKLKSLDKKQWKQYDFTVHN